MPSKGRPDERMGAREQAEGRDAFRNRLYGWTFGLGAG